MAYPYFQNYPQYFNPYVSQTAPQSAPQNQTIQNGGFITVRSEDEARNYPVAPGNSVTFRDEAAPYIYTKTMGFSQLDRPVFERYRLVKEQAENAIKQPEEQKAVDLSAYALKADLDAINAEIQYLKDEICKKSAKKAGIADEHI